MDVDWIYRSDGGSDAYFCDRHIAIFMQHGDEFTVTWLMSGIVQRFPNSRYARESVYAAVHDLPWDENGKPERSRDWREIESRRAIA